MIFNEKSTVSDLRRFKAVLDVSSTNILEQVKAYDTPTRIGEYDVIDANDIGMQNMIMLWNVKTEEDLFKFTTEALIGEKIDYELLPLIDFLRLTILASETAKLAAEMFSTLKRVPEDNDIREISEMFDSSDFAIIDRFVKRTPIYTHEEASKVSWLIYYECFKSDTQDYDMQVMINEKKKV